REPYASERQRNAATSASNGCSQLTRPAPKWATYTFGKAAFPTQQDHRPKELQDVRMTMIVVANQERVSISRKRRRLVFAALGITSIAIAMPLYTVLSWQSNYAGYDEGVYWQTLRAMHAGFTLYDQIFYSQPPLFALSVYPLYILFGQSLVA